MASNPYVNKVVYGNDTLIDLTGDTVTADDIMRGKTAHDKSGEQITGTYVRPIFHNTTLDDYTPVPVNTSYNYKFTNSGYAVQTINDLTPDNANPPALGEMVSYRCTGYSQMMLCGYAIRSYNNVTPSNSSPVALTSGDFEKMNGNGYAIASYSDITPSDSSPASLTSGDIYKAGGNGYAIESYNTVTPSSSGEPFSAGFVKMTSAGYAYSSQPQGQMPHGYFYYTALNYSGSATQTVIYSLHDNSAASTSRNPATGTILINNDDLTVTKLATAYTFQAQFKKPCRVYVYDTNTETTYAANDTLTLSAATSYRIIFDV